MFPVEAPRELQIRVFHRLANKQYVLTLQLQDGDDVQTRVLEPFQQRRLPTCLYKLTLEYATVAVRESLSEHEAAQSLPASSPSNQASPPPTVTGMAGFIIEPGALGDMLLDPEERRWPRLLQNRGAIPGPMREAIAWYACDFLLRHRPTFFRTIGTLEDSYLKAIREKRAGRLAAISELQRCQSVEMERVRVRAEEKDCAPQDVQSVVAQHVSEIDALELHWRTETEQLELRQRTTYCEYIVDVFEQEMRQMRDVEDGSGAQACTHDAGSHGERVSRPSDMGNLASPLRAVPVHAARPASGVVMRAAASDSGAPSSAEVEPAGLIAEDIAQKDSRFLEYAEVRAVFGQRRVFFVLRLRAGDVMDLLHAAAPGGACAEGWAAVDADGAGPQLPPESLGMASYGHSYFARGSGLPLHGVGSPRLRPPAAAAPLAPSGPPRGGEAQPGSKGRQAFSSPSLRFWEPPRLPPPVRLSPNAYAERLRGLIIPTPENLQFESSLAVTLREFASRCHGVTDLHFPPLRAQLQSVRALTSASPLRYGDYFCTRHSNLGGVMQVAFHLLIRSSEEPASDEVPAAMHRALKRIMCDCHRGHVAELSLPLLLLDAGTSESSLSSAVAQRRAENALRALKGALTRFADELAPSEAPSLQLLNLVLPLSCTQSIKAGIPSVADTTLTFLKHSFQCV